ncbi:unnamed protein product [Discosporangium mesarthrocarpum]
MRADLFGNGGTTVAGLFNTGNRNPVPEVTRKGLGMGPLPVGSHRGGPTGTEGEDSEDELDEGATGRVGLQAVGGLLGAKGAGLWAKGTGLWGSILWEVGQSLAPAKTVSAMSDFQSFLRG